MHSDRDDALRWEGDDDPTGAVHGPAPAPALPAGWQAVGKGSETVGRVEADGTVVAASEPQALSTPALVTVGVIAGVYLLYSVGWAVGGLNLQGFARFFVTDAAYLPMMWLAIAAPGLWFAASWLLTRGAKDWVRIAALVGGALVLIPWPFVFFGAVGAGA